MTAYFSDAVLVAMVGAAGGLLLGLAARFGRFCTLGALEDFFYGGSALRLRMWGIAIGVAIVSSFGAAALGLIDLSTTAYLSQSLNIPASIIGGLMFGYGMALAGNCGFGALARLGGGDLRSFVIVLVIGLSAYIAMSGPLAQLRVTAFPHYPVPDAPAGIAHWINSTFGADTYLTGMMIGGLILAGSITSRNLQEMRKPLFWGAVVGIAITSGWVGSTHIDRIGFEAISAASHTFSAPLGETMLYAMTASARSVSFGVGSVFGVLIGAFIGSLFKGHFRWEACDDPRELRRQILGSALLGIGAVIAMGCSVGQGLSAFSVLAMSAPITLCAIVVGAYVGLRQLIEGFASPS